jgi:HlyD family secretion protein
MAKLDPTVSTLTLAGVLAVASSLMLNWAAANVSKQQVTGTDSGAALAADAPAGRQTWAASSTGRVEPKDGEVRITAQTGSKIVEVIAKTNDRVKAGDLLVRLDDDDLFSRLLAAEAEAEVRVRERDEEPAKGIALEQHQAEDKAAASDRAAFRARLALDDVLRDARAGKASDDAVKQARDKLAAAEKTAADDHKALDAVNAKPGVELPTRLESSLAAARADVTQAENAVERARIRAPVDGAVLNMWAKVGETAMPSPEAPLLLFGDLSTLKVRAEVEERDVPKIHIGQRAIVRADAYPDHDFEGIVTQMAPALGPPRITTRGPRRPNDVEVLEALVSLDGQPLLLTGMRVDVFFKSDSAADAGAAPQQAVAEKDAAR